MASEIKPLKEEDITPNQAIDFIGNALANESLKLSQREHLLLVKCYGIVKEKINICECKPETRKLEEPEIKS